MLNKATLIGHLGKNPEMRYTQSNDAICNFSLATSERWKDKTTGEQKEATEWHRVTFFGKLAEIAGKYLQKGALVYVEGKIRTREFTDQTGQKRYITEILGDKMQMLSKSEAQAKSDPKAFEADDDIPF